MTLGAAAPIAPMEAEPAKALPTGPDWQYEPKWDGFRCLIFRDGAEIELQSKAGRSLPRYFPEVVEAARLFSAKHFVLDGEIVVPLNQALSFDILLQRIHPASTRIAKLSREHPALYIAFDLLFDERGRPIHHEPLRERRARLERFLGRFAPPRSRIRLSPATSRLATTRTWLSKGGTGLDGIIAKRTDLPYLPGSRNGMHKIKFLRTADCVVGGARYGERRGFDRIASLLLGLFDDHGVLHYIGHITLPTSEDTPQLRARLRTLRRVRSFTGRAPGGKSRWSKEEPRAWVPIAPQLVVEVRYDHFTGDRFRHGAAFVRWRPDKPPEDCTMAQVRREAAAPLLLLRKQRASATRRLR